MRAGQSQFTIGLLAIALLTATLLLLQADDPSSKSSASQGSTEDIADLSLLEHVLDRYETLARNVTQRISVVEQAILQMQRQQKWKTAKAALRYRSPVDSAVKPSSESGEPDSDAGESEQSGGDEGGDGSGEEEGGGETEEERLKRVAEETKEQNQLIKYDPATNTFNRYRPDFKCGDRVPPLPDNEAVECSPGGESPCCSSLGWCGKSKIHCACDNCEDYRRKVKLTLTGVEPSTKEHECGQIAYDFGEQKNPLACASLALHQIECGRLIMFSEEYPIWGCRCCAANSGPSAEVKPQWALFQLKVEWKTK